jgi:hypothetical protein
MYAETLAKVSPEAHFYTGRGVMYGLVDVDGKFAYIQGPIGAKVQEMTSVPSDLVVDVLEPEYDKEMAEQFMTSPFDATIEVPEGTELVALGTLPPNSTCINKKKNVESRVLRHYPALKTTQLINTEGTGRAYTVPSEHTVYPKYVAPADSKPAPTTVISKSEMGDKKATKQLAKGNFNPSGAPTKLEKVKSITKEEMPEGYDMTADMVSTYYGVKKVVVTWRARHEWFKKGGVSSIKVGNEWYFKSAEIGKYQLTPAPAASYLLPEGPKSLEEVLAESISSDDNAEQTETEA